MAEPRKTVARSPDLRAVIDASAHGLGRDGESQTLPGRSRLIHYANLVRLPHTLFALPFALLGTIYASHQRAVTIEQVGLVLLAFTAARFAAMGFNRIVDHQIDARNPRTRSRELPAGRLTVREAAVSVSLASAVFIVAAGLLNPLCLALSPLALAWILAYSYTKRFTSWSHLWLGASLAIAPVGGFVAVTGAWSTPWWTLVVLAAGVLCWVSGFDMFYALQDLSFDRQNRLKSVPVLLGESRSILLAKLLHGGAIGLFALFGIGAGFGWPYFAGLAVSAAILAWEHHLVKPGDLSRVDQAFFTSNGLMSVVMFAFTLMDRWL